MNAAPPVTSGTHVYRINAVRLCVLPAIWLLLVSMLLGVLGSSAVPGEAAAGIGAAAILTLILAPIYYLGVWRSRLELDERGIAHRQFGYAIRGDWSNLERLSLQPGAEGLYLRMPGTDSALLRGSVRVLQSMPLVGGGDSTFGDADALAEGRCATPARSAGDRGEHRGAFGDREDPRASGVYGAGSLRRRAAAGGAGAAGAGASAVKRGW